MSRSEGNRAGGAEASGSANEAGQCGMLGIRISEISPTEHRRLANAKGEEEGKLMVHYISVVHLETRAARDSVGRGMMTYMPGCFPCVRSL